MWAAGDDVLLRRDPTLGWQEEPAPGRRILHLWGLSANDVWAVGDGAPLHYNGTSWSEIPIDGPEVFSVSAVSALDGNDVWMMAQELSTGASVLLNTNGSTWIKMPLGVTLHDLWSDGSSLFAAGDAGVWRYQP